MVKTIPQLTEIAPPNSWRIKQVHRSLSDTEVLWISPLNNAATFMLRIPKSQSALLGFEHQKKICASLREDARLGEWRQLLPNFLYDGQFQGRPYSVEEQLPGINAMEALSDLDKRQTVQEAALKALTHLHQKTATTVVVDDKLLQHLVLNPLQIIQKSILVYYHHRSYFLLERLGQQLSKALLGQPIMVSWVHGDYWPANILVTPDGNRVTGIVDWELSQPIGLPSLDLVNLLISTRRIEEGKELGEILTQILHQESWRKYEQVWWEQAQQMAQGNIPCLRDVLLIFWLQHLSANVNKTWRYSVNPIWTYSNFLQVLNCL